MTDRRPASAARRDLAARAIDTSPDHPWPVRYLADQIARYIDRMPPLWVEGQVVQYSRRPGTTMAFLTLRDTDQDMSLPVAALTRVVDAMAAPLTEGAHVVIHAKPVFWTKRGSFQLSADTIRPLGVGDLLARIDQLRRVLAAEGLFDAERKRPLPFLPTVIGLICGRESKAEHDVVVNARARWPGVEFDIREVAVQGVDCVPQVSAALVDLDADPRVDVVVIARGGGSVEDLLPFSNESLIRAVAACRTPVVSAIGHETDTPLLDLVADLRASTPTDAAKRIVPDVAEERLRLRHATQRLRTDIVRLIERETERLAQLRARPSLATPTRMLADHEERLVALTVRARHAMELTLERASADIAHLTVQCRGLSPWATLQRGYAVVRRPNGRLVRDTATDVTVNDTVHIRIAEGAFTATVDQIEAR